MPFLLWLEQFLHPGKVGYPGGGYWFWSGIGSGSPLFVMALGYLKHHNCHEKGCWRLGHPHPDTNHLPVCRRHHPATL